MTNTVAAGFSRTGNDAGFSLLETMIAMAILATGLLSLAGVFIMGLNQLSGSSASLIAREKAREAVESVHTARDTKTVAWCQIRNSDAPTNCADGATGAFLPDALPLRTPGPDGLVNTNDDGDIEVAVGPGPDNILGNSDDTRTPLDNYTRQIEITDLLMANGQPNPNLRRLTVTINFRVGPNQRTYTLTTFISAIS
jgi:prepilin-type N-terminal cleavage/methylation domain-containing protein